MIHFLRYAMIGGLVSAVTFGFEASFGDQLSAALWTVADAVNF